MAWNRKTLNDLIEDLAAGLQSMSAWANVDTSQYSAIGQGLRAIAKEMDRLYSLHQAVETGLDPTVATGRILVGQAAFVGLQQKLATQSVAPVTYTATAAGCSVTKGDRFYDGDTSHYWTAQNSVTVPASGTYTDHVVAEDYGPITISSTQNLTPITTIVGLDSADISGAVVAGQYDESWDDLRARVLEFGMSPRGTGSVDSLEARINELDWVQACGVETNRSLAYDAATDLLGKTYRVTIYPSTADATELSNLALLLWDQAGQPAGALPVGTQEQELKSQWGGYETIRWEWATTETIDVTCVINDTTLGDNAPSQIADRQSAIEAALTSYFAALSAVGGTIYESRVIAYMVDSISWINALSVSFREHGTADPFEDHYDVDHLAHAAIGTITYGETA